MHLKNWSLIENGPLVELAPAYDLLSTRLLLDDDEDSALALDDRKSGFDRRLLIDYLGREVCEVNERMIKKNTPGAEPYQLVLKPAGQQAGGGDRSGLP